VMNEVSVHASVQVHISNKCLCRVKIFCSVSVHKYELTNNKDNKFYISLSLSHIVNEPR